MTTPTVFSDPARARIIGRRCNQQRERLIAARKPKPNTDPILAVLWILFMAFFVAAIILTFCI